MKIKDLKKIIRNKNLSYKERYKLLLDYYNIKALSTSRRYCSSDTRIIDEQFYVTTQTSIGYINRESKSYDISRALINNDNDKGLLFAEVYESNTLSKTNVAHFKRLNDAVKWVSKYGHPYSEKVVYYYITKNDIYRIWNSTHLMSLNFG